MNERVIINVSVDPAVRDFLTKLMEQNGVNPSKFAEFVGDILCKSVVVNK